MMNFLLRVVVLVGKKVQNRVLEARYGLGPLHNYCMECKKKVILFNDL